MRIYVYRWPGRRGRRSAAFGWHHYHVLRGTVISWKRDR